MQIKIAIKKAVLAFALLPVLMAFQNCGGSFHSQQTQQASLGTVNSDTEPPAVAILAPLAQSYLKKQSVLSGSCEAGLTVSYYVDDIQTTATTTCTAGSFSITLNAGLTDGAHMAWVSQTDLSGNKTVQSLQFNIDNTAPVVTFTAPAAGQSINTSSALTIGGTCETGLRVRVSGSALTAPLDMTCLNGAFQGSGTVVATAGAMVLSAVQTDLAGNDGTISRNVTVSVPAIPVPQVRISQPAANALLKAANITLQGTCETGLNVRISGAVTAASQVACTAGAFSAAVQLSAGDGSKNAVAAQTNAQGGSGQDSRTFNVDTTPPAVKIVSPAAGTTGVTGITLGGNCESGLTVNIAGAGILAAATAACANGMFTANITFSAVIGQKIITVTQTDAAGNTGTDSRTFERIAPPALDGKLLYANNCAGCHGALASSTKLGRTAQQITLAIQNYNEMKSIKLTAAEIDAVAAALSLTTQPPPATVPTLPLATVRVALTPANLQKDSAFAGVPMRRLSRVEMDNTLTDVFKVAPTGLISLLPVDLEDEKLFPFDNNSETQSVSTFVVERFEEFATKYAAMVAAQPATIRTLAACTPTGANDIACFRKFANKVGRLLLRRPITAAELTRYETLMTYANTAGNFYEGPKLMVQALVQHPEFLYRVEAGQGTSGTLTVLSQFEIGSRLSYLIWGSAPDEALVAAAEAGQLATAAQRTAQAQRMLADGRAKRQWRRYHAQWLGYEGAQVPAALAADMKAESNALVDQIVFNSTGAWTTIYSYAQSYVSPALATHYGITVPAAAAWVPRPGGILANGQFLAQGAKFGDTSPTLRGYKIMKRVLCQELGPVPLGVDPDVQPGVAGQCKPARYSMRTQTTCQGCHALTDNIGFGLENFSPSGQFRTAEPGLPSCTISGEGSVGTDLFKGIQQLGANLEQNPAAVQCAAKQLLRYTLGRTTRSTDQETVEAMHAQYLKTPQLTSMIQAIVQSPAFGYR